MNFIKECPICLSVSFNDFMKIKDHMISKEFFNLSQCSICNFVFTNPIPNKENIGKYYNSDKYISHSSTNKGVINKIYKKVRNITLKNKKNTIEKYTKINSLLDIGCGTGHFLKYISKFNNNILGLEPSLNARNFSKKQNIKVKDISHLYELKDESFNVITMWHVLEHVYDLRKDFKKISKILQKNGFIFIAVPNRNSYDAKIYKEKWAAYDVPRHLYHFIKKDLIELSKQFNLEYINTIPMKYDSFYVSLLSEEYINGSKIKAFINGLLSNIKAKKFGYSSHIYIFKKN